LEGRKADLTIFKQTPLKIARKTKIKADCGYQGIKKVHPNSQTPIKKPKNGELTKKQKKKNKKLRKKRVKIEHTNRRCKCFRIVKETYRNHLNHISSVWLIICGLVNLNL
jgi:uncharacterized protein (DUF2344 family)